MKEEELLGAFSVTVKFRNLNDGFVWLFTAVYGATDPLDYDQFWQELFDIKTIYSDPWCLGEIGMQSFINLREIKQVVV